MTTTTGQDAKRVSRLGWIPIDDVAACERTVARVEPVLRKIISVVNKIIKAAS